jgi:hypothetical protein
VTVSTRRSAPPRAKGFLEAPKTSFIQALRTPEGTAEPAAFLWTDADRQWVGLMARLQASRRVPFILTSFDRAPQAANQQRTKEQTR